MNLDFAALLDGCSPQQIDSIFQLWDRLKALTNQAAAFQFLKRMKQGNNLEVLLMLQDQEILANFIQEQPERSNHQRLVMQSSQRIISSDLNIFQRLERQLLQSLEEYQAFNTFTRPFIKQALQFTKGYKNNSKILDDSEIKLEVSRVKNKVPNFENIHAFLQLVDSALYHTTKQHRLRQTQIIALLFFLIGGCNKILLEILTGQGKSTTISCLAAILTISGKEVDIVTTSDLLAKRDVQEKRNFYNLFGLEVDHNFIENQKNEKKCYENKKIVYGTPHSFQVDILFDQYKKRGTRCRRPFSVLIVDEVDSMFIDQKDHQTLLSSTFPGFYELIHPMKIIWSRINCNPIFRENQEVKMALAVGKNETVTAKIEDVMNEVIKQIREVYKNEIIPEWRMQFIQLSLEKWIDSAITAAFIYKQNKQYIIKNKKIAPVDYKNNGAVQENVHWENGLHQFLQIKHGLPVTTEGMTSNFISNLGHFDKYKELYGLTGTLGSGRGKSFLKQTYHASLMKIPPFKERRLQIQPGSVLYDETQWANYICQRVQIMLVCQRSVLILCQTIAQANLLNSALKLKKISAKRIQNLQRGSQKIDDNIDCQQIFIATNLAGRGADLKISQKLNQRGGLHVIIAFMPINSRVQMQGRGRAGRNGCYGSSQLAVNYKKHCEQLGLDPQNNQIMNTGLRNLQIILFLRDQLQASRMLEDQQRVYNLRCKDKIFNIYCEGVNKIPDFHKNNAKQQAVQEKFAMFLKRADKLNIQFGDLEHQATNLVKDFQKNSDNFYNPNHYVGRGINQLCEGKQGEAIQMFEHAEKGKVGSLPQIIGGIYANCCKLNQNKQNRQNIRSNLQNLQKIRQVIEQRKQMVRGTQIIDNQLQRITEMHKKIHQKDNKMFQKKIKGIQSEPIELINNDFPSVKNNNSQNQQHPRDEQLRQNIKHMSSGEERILDGLSHHLQDVIKKYQNLKEDEYIQFNFEPINRILSRIDGDDEENKDSLDNYKPNGLHFLPEPVIKVKQKKKVSFWKRVTVFLLGIAQIVLGAIIVASTAGALSSFGVTAMLEGAKYCFDSIFRPQQLADLTKYFSKTAITYAFALAASGLEGIKQLGTLGKNGFKMFSQMPLGTFIENTMKNVGIGFQKVATNYFSSLKGAGTFLISSGLSNLLGQKQKDLRQMVSDPISRVQQSSKSIIQQIKKQQKEDSKHDKEYLQIRQKFKDQITLEIKNIISKTTSNTFQQIKNLPLNPSILSQLISSAVFQHCKLPTSGPKLQQITDLVRKQWVSKASQAFRKAVNFEQKILDSLRNLPKNQQYQKWIQKGLLKLFLQSLKKTDERKRAQFENKKRQLESLYSNINNNSSRMAASTFNNQVARYNQKQQEYNSEVTARNQFINKVDCQAIMEQLKLKKAIQKDGRLNPHIIRSLSIHEYAKQILLNLQYKGPDKQFQEILEVAIFNAIGNYGLKIMDRIFYEKGGSKQRLAVIQKLVRK